MKEHHLTIKELPEADRPREKLLKRGATALTDAELLAIILRMGAAGETVLTMAQRLLREHNGLNGIAAADHAELRRARGLGPAKAAQLLAAMELGRRVSLGNAGERVRIGSPADVVARLRREMADPGQERLVVVLLNTKNDIISIEEVYKGSLNSSPVRISELFQQAVRRQAASIILAHNHPSGDPTPSPEDVEVTRQAVEAGKLLDIDVIDHIILGKSRHLSFREQQLVFDRH